MAEHDAKTPTSVGITGTSGPMNEPAAPVASIKVAHLVGGQVFIGQVVFDRGARPHYMEWPYEVFVMPNPHQGPATITLIKHGSMVGLMPQLASNRMVLEHHCLSIVDPHDDLVMRYLKALEREANPVTKEEVAARIKPGQMSGGPDA